VTVHGHPDEFYDAHAVNDPAMALPENVPLVVLVDHVTAAGAELVAAALQDHRRATIIGQKTFGRGSVQTLLMLGQGWAMKMTTATLRGQMARRWSMASSPTAPATCKIRR
jgi:C-terminal processing protease CtpA/Prc